MGRCQNAQKAVENTHTGERVKETGEGSTVLDNFLPDNFLGGGGLFRFVFIAKVAYIVTARLVSVVGTLGSKAGLTAQL